ncbi:MAG: exodeoxyribonuclease VII large subunit [Firmicutes bacterium]|jgi:exodeoxyribonuclease VII large subunit|nr:exodeoxyribonuclease VII large subunit [Bacillota bacterium]
MNDVGRLPGMEYLRPRFTVYSVGELTRHIKSLLDRDPLLRGVLVRGEISNFRRHTSGHVYFTLKDEACSLRCVMFRSMASGLGFDPRDGMEVVASGYVTVYERDGQYQLYVQALQPYGVGAYYLALEQLKKKLAGEGLFDPSRKRPLPRFPRRVGVVTSVRGAAIRDIVSVSRRRFPAVKLLVCDVTVQGEESPGQIVRALSLMNAVADVDVIIVGRGGGSTEELWAFNDERLARAIAASRVPVVSAVGHETDLTIADFVADVRAPTPSAAAEMVVPDAREVAAQIAESVAAMARSVDRRLRAGRDKLRMLRERPALRRPGFIVDARRQVVDELTKDLVTATRNRFASAEAKRALLAGRLDALNPLSVLRRGYSVCRRDADGKVVSSTSHVEPGDSITVRVADGQFGAAVNGKGVSP